MGIVLGTVAKLPAGFTDKCTYFLKEGLPTPQLVTRLLTICIHIKRTYGHQTELRDNVYGVPDKDRLSGTPYKLYGVPDKDRLYGSPYKLIWCTR